MLASPSVAALVTLVAAVVTVFLEGLSGVAADTFRRTFSRVAIARDEERVECSSTQVSLGGMVVYQTDTIVFERIARLVEREVLLLEQRQRFYDTAVAVVSSHQFVAIALLLLGVVFFVCGARHGGGSRTVQPRSPNPRPLLQRGAGTLARAGDHM